MRTMPIVQASLICSMLGLTAAIGCGVEEEDATTEALTEAIELESDSQLEPEAELVTENHHDTKTWYKPMHKRRPVSQVAFIPGHGNNDDQPYNDKGALLFCKWKGFKKVVHWEGGHGGHDVQSGTQRFHVNHPGDPPKMHCQKCKHFIKKIKCKK